MTNTERTRLCSSDSVDLLVRMPQQNIIHRILWRFLRWKLQKLHDNIGRCSDAGTIEKHTKKLW